MADGAGDDSRLEAAIDDVRSVLPGPEELWAQFDLLIREWAEPVDDAEGGGRFRAHGDGHEVQVLFGPEEWCRYVAAGPARAVLAGKAAVTTYLNWDGIRDDLQEVVDSGYPLIGIRDHQLVGLLSADGPAWPALPDPDEGAVEPGGSWTPR